MVRVTCSNNRCDMCGEIKPIIALLFGTLGKKRKRFWVCTSCENKPDTDWSEDADGLK